MHKSIFAMSALVFLPFAAASLAETAAADALADAVAGEWRAAEDKARDEYRHPEESLEFWGLEPGMTILEVQPGGGWWSDILAPYAHATGGRYYATAADLDDPALSQDARDGRNAFESKYGANPDLYGKVELVNWGPKSKPLPANRFDFILTARSVHGWIGGVYGITPERAFEEFARALKPGGILAVEQHRADPDASEVESGGYVTEAYVIRLAEDAGLELEAKSEINANPKDTKDHPFGVWTLPPARQSAEEEGQPSPPGFDRSRYDAIGESDRMTLKFRKPD